MNFVSADGTIKGSSKVSKVKKMKKKGHSSVPYGSGYKKVNEEPRKPRKKGQRRNSPNHSDLYTDENPKGTIHGLKFATVKDATKSVSKIKSSGKSHAHKIQAAVAMEQRAREMGKSSQAAVYRKFINQMKKKTKQEESKMSLKLEELVGKPITEAQFDEAAGKKDACYHKVKARYDVWPSAYASGALVKCRKVGAANWGNKSKKEDVYYESITENGITETHVYWESDGKPHGYTFAFVNELNEAEYQGRKVKLGKIMQGDTKKFKVYVKNPKGNVVKVNFGQGGGAKGGTMRIRKSNPKARKNFRARHNCDNPGPRHKARYWSCRKW